MLQILAMGNLSQLVALGPEGVAPLLDLLQTGAPNKQFAAVKALGEINDPRVRPAMIEALKKPSVAVRIAALGVLERSADPSVHPEVEKLLQDKEASVRGAAVEAAARCGGARSVPALLKCLKDESWEVRQATANALGSLGDSSAVDGICELINDPDRDVRESAVAALAAISDRRAIVPLATALYDEESSVRNAATAALHQIDRRWIEYDGMRQIVPKIKSALQHHDYWVRHSAGQLLERLKVTPNWITETPAAPEYKAPETQPMQHPALAVLADLLFDRDRDLRLAAAQAFRTLGDKGAGSLLAAAQHDGDSLVREAAQEALMAMN
jgi:HEAT repeat protein